MESADSTRTRLIGLFGIFVLVVLTGTPLVCLWCGRYVRVFGYDEMRLGRLELQRGVTQSFEFVGPEAGAIAYSNGVYFYLEYAGESLDTTEECAPTGRCRITIRDGDGALVKWEGEPYGRITRSNSPDGTTYRIECSGMLAVDATGTAFAMPTPGCRYAVEFEWVELPESESEVYLNWGYPTYKRLSDWSGNGQEAVSGSTFQGWARAYASSAKENRSVGV